jgi:hypothetical protein
MGSDTLEQLRDEVRSLSNEVYRLAALEKIKGLKYRYFDIIDHFKHGEIGEVFTRDARAVMGPYGALEGRDALVKFFDEVVFPSFDLILHGGHNPRIQLTSDRTARGTWMYETYQLTRENPPGSVWLCGLYKDEYAIEDGEWKISSLSGSYYFNTAITTPFSQERFSPYPPGAPGLPDEFRIVRSD